MGQFDFFVIPSCDYFKRNAWNAELLMKPELGLATER